MTESGIEPITSHSQGEHYHRATTAVIVIVIISHTNSKTLIQNKPTKTEFI